MPVYIEAHAWITAWEQAMAERGYPHARIDLELPRNPTDDINARSYSWTLDVDLIAVGEDEVAWFQEEHSDGWREAHEVFLAVDHLRPANIIPSTKLQQLLTERN